MEDLVWILLVGLLIMVVVGLVLAGFALAATIASVCVFGAAASAFFVTMYRGILHRGGAAAASGPDEPSFRAYYRGQVWRDLGLAATAAWTGAMDETGRIRQLVPQSWDGNLQTVVRAALTVYAFVGLAVGAVLAMLIGLVPALLIALFAAVAWAAGAPIRGLERVRRKRTGAYFDCQVCHDRFPLPQYVCPLCDARHRQLAPGPFGVLRHRCTCGARLPAVELRGRERLPAECPQGHPLSEGVGVIRTFHVPVAGGPSTGKSTYLAAALLELDEAAAAGTLATTVQATSRKDYDQILDTFRQGVVAPKTSGLPPAMVAEISGRSRSALLYAYDVAGEVYGSEDELRQDPAHGLAAGVVLLVDPFALTRVRTELEDDIASTPELRPSVEAPQRMLERLIGVLGEQGVDLSKINAAICITKVDALGIDEAIARSPGATEHDRVRGWLEQEGAGNFLRSAEGAFAEVRCFAVSALGRVPGTGSGSFVPRGAAAPMLWLLTRAGVEPAAPGEAQETRTHRIAAAAPPDVAPKRPIFAGPIDAVATRGYAVNFGVGLLAVAVLAGSASAAAPLMRSGGSSSSDTFVADDVVTDGGQTPTDGGGDPPVETDTTTETPTEPQTTTEPEPSDPEPSVKANSPAGVIGRHFDALASGDYEGAFKLMSASYRRINPDWVDQPSAAEPFVDVVELGEPRRAGSGVAHVPITFYARDQYETDASDTGCWRFSGYVQARKENGRWRYDPLSNHLDKTAVRRTRDVCNP